MSRVFCLYIFNILKHIWRIVKKQFAENHFKLLKFLMNWTKLSAFQAVTFWVSMAFSEDLPSEKDPSIFYNMIELVCMEGYSIQEHAVTTEDGYILTIFRVPNGERRARVTKKSSHYQWIHSNYHPDFRTCVNESLTERPSGPPVLLSHGLLGASDGWVLQGSNDDLAFMLADSGYDVWLSNIRGNFYSRRHQILKPSNTSFWDFSFHESGIYDMSATIDYILKLRGVPKLTYVGHSMGTTMLFALLATKPEYNDKIKLHVALTPVGLISRSNYSSSMQEVVSVVFSLLRALDRLGVHEFLPRTYFPNLLAKTICAKGSPLQDLCYDILFFFVGNHSKLFLRKKFPLYISHFISGSSVKSFYHFEQLMNASRFQWYDYGPEENTLRYGAPQPPQYDLKKVTIPTALYYSKGDYLAQFKDVENLKKLLPKVIKSRLYSGYSHVDFLWAYNAKKLLYEDILRLIDSFRQ